MTATKLMNAHERSATGAGEVQCREQGDGAFFAQYRWQKIRAQKRKQNARASRTIREKTLV
ncbi:hypothetical protein WN982_06870 [Paraburkholderia sp. IMGN_8]|uniref:hypothetical protein n=1 Tax=Paraburkholderia sp. IMGN_8 TaxID=3136564 RepID=UPI0031011957